MQKYVTEDGSTIFLRSKISKGESWKLDDQWRANNIIILLRGSLIVDGKNYERRILEQPKLFFALNTYDYLFTAVVDVEFLVVSSNKIVQYLPPIDTAKFKKNVITNSELEVKDILFTFIASVNTYIEGRVINDEIIDVKLSEFLLIIRAIYSDDEYVAFFHKIIGTDVDFVSRVLSEWEKVKNASELAKHFGMGEKTLQRMFKLHFNATPYNWMQREKAEIIGLMLRNRNIPIKNIIDDYDFSSRSHFNTYCKKMYGGTPLQVRSFLNDNDHQ